MRSHTPLTAPSLSYLVRGDSTMVVIPCQGGADRSDSTMICPTLSPLTDSLVSTIRNSGVVTPPSDITASTRPGVTVGHGSGVCRVPYAPRHAVAPYPQTKNLTGVRGWAA